MLKHSSDGLIEKIKAWIGTKGDHQIQGNQFFKTYVPVVQLTMIHLMLILEA